MTPHALILIPEEGDPHGLLAEGVCGARPPTAWLHTDDPGLWIPSDVAHDDTGEALVLAWDGESVPEGMDRWWRAGFKAHGAPRWPYVAPSTWRVPILVFWHVLEPVALLGGTLVALGPDGLVLP